MENEEDLTKVLTNTAYILPEHQDSDYENIMELFKMLLESGHDNFYFVNDSGCLIPLAIKFAQTNKVKIHVVHSSGDHYYFYSEVDHLFIADGEIQDLYLKRYCNVCI